MMQAKVRSVAVLVLVSCACWSCASGGGAGGGSGGESSRKNRPSATQSDQEIAQIIRGLKPTERLVANADSQLLWQATEGYMSRAFPLDQLPPEAASVAGSRQIRTKLVEWTGDGLPHRTRVFVENRTDPSNPANVKLRVSALMIESEPQLEKAQPGTPIEYKWRLVGSNQQVEETISEQIMRRYLALTEGKPLPVDEELVLPRAAVAQ